MRALRPPRVGLVMAAIVIGVQGPATALARAPTHAPTLPPILAPARGATAPAGTPAPPSAEAAQSQTEADPLVGNGLGSPSCRVPERYQLSRSALRDCRLSGFVAAPAPTGDYGIDVHIDTGLGGFGTETLLGTVQEALVLPTWMALVWAVHVLLVLIEWGFSLELLGAAAEAQVGRELAGAEAQITWPWLPAALALAGVLAAYRGLVRRRVVDALGEVVVIVAMMAGGLWAMSDPGGTVGALNRWSAETSTGALALATGAPASAPALGDGLGSVFAQAVEGPWCYLEFGDVGWCEDPTRLDPRLHAAGLAAAAEETRQAGCTSKPPTACRDQRGDTAHVLRASAELLREARTNAAVFLALPANGPVRNSINSSSSFLHVLCASSEAGNCRGPTAAQAQFRTASGTQPRLAGLALIATGLVGMLLLLGYVAVRLVTAASRSFVYLLMAPALVLSPAFGARGRALFRVWASRLLGAVLAKLVFAFVLGVLLSVSAIIASVPGLGWWAQWMMLACFWWSAFVHRHSLLTPSVAHAGRRDGGFVRPLAYGISRSAAALALRRLVAHRDEREASVSARAQLDEIEQDRPPIDRPPADGPLVPGGEVPVEADVLRLLDADARVASTAGQEELRTARTVELQAQLERVEHERLQALVENDRRRAIELGVRRSRVRGELEQHRLASLREAAAAERSGASAAPAGERDRFLDHQAAAAEARQRPRALIERNYAALAPLAGFDADEYERLDPAAKRRTRLEVDRRLRGRRARLMDGWPDSDERTRRAARKVSRPIAAPRPRWPPGEIPPLDERASRDPVMRDLWAVAAGKKRQLGIGRE